MKVNNPITLLDTRGLMMKAYHGSTDTSLTDSSGKPMASWKGGMSKFLEDTLLPILQGGAAPSRVIAAWDGGNTLRRTLFPDYKSKRREREQDPLVIAELKMLEEKVKRLLAYVGVRSVFVSGEECDDLLALLVEKLEYSHAMIYTNDKDLVQLVGRKVTVILGGEVVSA